MDDGMDLGLQQKLLDILEENNEIDFVMITQVMTMLVAVRTTYKEFLTLEGLMPQVKSFHFREEVSFYIDPKWTA